MSANGFTFVSGVLYDRVVADRVTRDALAMACDTRSNVRKKSVDEERDLLRFLVDISTTKEREAEPGVVRELVLVGFFRGVLHFQYGFAHRTRCRV